MIMLKKHVSNLVKRFALATFFLSFSAQLFAEAPANAASFSEILASLNTIAGNFTQTIKDPDGQVVQETTGKFKVKRPGYFLWEIAPPYEQIVIGTPEKLKLYDPDLEQLTIHKNDSLEGSPALLLSGDVKAIAKQYDIVHSKQKQLDSYTLKSKEVQDSAFETLQFQFHKQDDSYVLKAMMFVDKLGQSTVVALESVVVNAPVAEDQFEFSPPPGTDVILND